MTKTRKTSYPPINIGTSFMLMIFIVLCMVIFAVLSFSSAMKDVSYSEKNAQRTIAYYEANNQAERILSHIGSALLEAKPDETQMLLQALGEDLASGDAGVPAASLTVEPIPETGDLSVSYTVPISDTEALEVILTTQSQAGQPYTITTWKQVSTAEWTGSQTLPVLGSD